MLDKIKTIHEDFMGLDGRVRRNLLFCAGTMFLLLFSYPMMRSTTSALFMHHYGARNTPLVWTLSILSLGFIITLYNHFQVKIKIHRLFNWTVITAVLFFTISYFILISGVKIWVYPIYVAKEIYIVLLVNMVLGFVNSSVTVKTAKLVYGPIGALGGMGGIFGGLLTSNLTKHWEVEYIYLFSLIFIISTMFVFWRTDHRFEIKKESDDGKLKEESPLHSIKGVGGYVLCMTLLIALTQFVINIGNFKFNLLFHEIVPDKTEKTKYFGYLYSSINLLSVLVQIFIIPILFRFVKNRNIHLSIPVVYSFATFVGFGLLGNALLPVAATFIIYKGVDYSLFSSAKEILYFPLTDKQKYGAKYIIDMVCYRFSKGLISVVLIYFQSQAFINWSLAIFLVLWLVLLFPLFKIHDEVLGRNREIIDLQGAQKV